VSPIVVASASRAERRDGEWALSHLAASCVTRSPSRVTRGYTGTARRIEQGIKGALDVSLFMRVGAQEAVLYECRYRLLAQANAHAPHAVLPSLALAPRTGSAGADGRCRGHGHAVPPCTEPERVLLRAVVM
jgi:hypothetical protein